LWASDATLSSNTIIANSASQIGGGIFLSTSDAVLINNIVSDNYGYGSGLFIESSSVQLLYNTIARNVDNRQGGGIIVTTKHRFSYGPSTVWLTNTILVGHETGIIVTSGSTATLEATLWGSGEWANASDWSGGGMIVTGSINVWGDPAFADPDRGDYHIDAGSAALDAGITTEVTVDVDGDVRPIGDAPDLGADEWAPSESRQRGADWQSALWAVPALEPRLPTTRRFVTTQQKRERPAKMPVILSRKEGNYRKNSTHRVSRQGANNAAG